MDWSVIGPAVPMFANMADSRRLNSQAVFLSSLRHQQNVVVLRLTKETWDCLQESSRAPARWCWSVHKKGR